MADLFTHVLVAYTIGISLSWRFNWITPPYITGLMVGSTLPDLTRVGLILRPTQIEAVLGIPFSWTPLHLGIGVLISVLILSSFLSGQSAKRISLLLGVGAVSHLILDSLLRSASGYLYAVFWPLSSQNIIGPGLYLSSDMLPAVIAVAVAFVIWRIDKS
ncbi:MAG: metal-dependent hydrolase [Candidatus Thermoplasmatota archaeon]|nr:metal-dependent hydrolase [Candidatus Thermoplasmatota archaeon]